MGNARGKSARADMAGVSGGDLCGNEQGRSAGRRDQ